MCLVAEEEGGGCCDHRDQECHSQEECALAQLRGGTALRVSERPCGFKLSLTLGCTIASACESAERRSRL